MSIEISLSTSTETQPYSTIFYFLPFTSLFFPFKKNFQDFIFNLQTLLFLHFKKFFLKNPFCVGTFILEKLINPVLPAGFSPRAYCIIIEVVCHDVLTNPHCTILKYKIWIFFLSRAE